jgi:hypothetical protein
MEHQKCEKCSLEEPLKKYFNDTVVIKNCDLHIIKNITNIGSSGNYLKGNQFLNTIQSNYCAKFQDKNFKIKNFKINIKG